MNSCRELLERMISFDTSNGAVPLTPRPERKLALFLEELAVRWGLRARRCPVSNGEFNLLVTREVSAETDWLLFDSHLDTVSLSGMSIDPLVATCRDGRLFGRGACDTKGSGAAMLWALKQYAMVPRQSLNVGILFSLDEERGMTGAEAFTRGELRELAPKTRGVIVGEPTQMRPVIAHGGVLRGKIVTHGRAAHSSNPSNGQSAISAMVKVVEAFESSYVPSVRAWHPLAGKAAASINVIRGGTQANIIPDRCEVEFDRRLMPGESVNGSLEEIASLLDRVRIAHPGARLDWETTFSIEPLNPEGGESFTRMVREALEKENFEGAPEGAPWTTNASHYARLIPAIVLGPGDIAQAHTKDEWISLSQLEDASRVYLNLMLAN